MPSAIDIELEGNDEPVHVASNQVESVAIIGGGASGAITLDCLLKEKSFKNISVFERRSTLGGIWALDEFTIETPNQIIKSGYTSSQTDPQLPNPFDICGAKEEVIVLPKNEQERFLQTPSYSNITTNIIEKMMTYSDYNEWVPGKSKSQDTTYVGGKIVRKYIDDYISRNTNDNSVNLLQNVTVEDVEKIKKDDSSSNSFKFRLTLRKPKDNELDIWWREEFDAIVVATGHYHIPFIPYVEGLSDLQKRFDGVVQHSKFYRKPEPYQNKKVIIVGSRASAADLTKLIADKAEKVYQSIRNTASSNKISKKSNIFYKGVIKKIQIVSDTEFRVIFDDDSEVTNPDNIIYATGYQFSYPFLNRLFGKSQKTVTKEGIVISDLYQHTFSTSEPLISFVGVPVDGISFRVFEYQAILVARYLSGKIDLPPKNKQLEWILKRYESKGLSRAYHTIGFADAFEFLSTLIDLGTIKNDSQIVGREFPVLSVEDLELYRKSGEELRKFWDER